MRRYLLIIVGILLLVFGVANWLIRENVPLSLDVFTQKKEAGRARLKSKKIATKNLNLNEFKDKSFSAVIEADLPPAELESLDIDPELLFPQTRSRKRMQEFAAAATTGKLDSLHIIRPENISDIPKEEHEFIRNKLLSELFKRIGDEDWANWPAAYQSDEGRATVAREFVDNVETINPELGQYLDTAVYLMSRQRKEFREGRELNLLKELSLLYKNAESIYSFRRSLTVDLKERIDIGIADDLVFTNFLEFFKVKLISESRSRYPSKLLEHLELIDSLDSYLVGHKVTEILSEMISDIATKASLVLRKKFAVRLVNSSTILEIADQSEDLQILLAQLFALVSVDSIESANPREARQFLVLSERMSEGLSAQQRVRNIFKRLNWSLELEKNPMEAERPEIVGAIEKSSSSQRSFGDLLNEGKNAAKRGIGQFLVYLFLGIIVLGILLKILLSYLSSGSRAREIDLSDDYGPDDYSSVADDKAGSKGEGNYQNSAEEIEFDDLSDLDELFEQGNAG